jgi:hypothetical protein
LQSKEDKEKKKNTRWNYLKCLDELVESSRGGRLLIGGEVGAHLPEAGQKLSLATHVHLPTLDHAIAHLEEKKDLSKT